MIQIRNIKDLPVQLWYKEEYQGMVETFLQYLDVRLQIKNAQVEGYSFWVNGKWIPINKDGKIYHKPPVGFFSKVDDYLTKLI